MKRSAPTSTSTMARTLSRAGLISAGLATLVIGWLSLGLPTGKASHSAHDLSLDVAMSSDQLEVKLVIGKMTMIVALSFSTHADAVA